MYMYIFVLYLSIYIFVLHIAVLHPAPRTCHIPHYHRVREATANDFSERLQFVLGTESGMVTSIVRTVQRLLREAQRADIEVEIVFPVSAEAITTEAQVWWCIDCV